MSEPEHHVGVGILAHVDALYAPLVMSACIEAFAVEPNVVEQNDNNIKYKADTNLINTTPLLGET